MRVSQLPKTADGWTAMAPDLRSQAAYALPREVLVRAKYFMHLPEAEELIQTALVALPLQRFVRGPFLKVLVNDICDEPATSDDLLRLMARPLATVEGKFFLDHVSKFSGLPGDECSEAIVLAKKSGVLHDGLQGGTRRTHTRVAHAASADGIIGADWEKKVGSIRFQVSRGSGETQRN